MSEKELNEQRGGFSWGGLDIRFGAEIRSYLGDALVIQTNLSWTDKNDVSRTVSTALAAAGLATGVLAESGLKVTGAEVFFANAGQTAFVQRTDGGIQNVIVNTASGVALRQQVDATLDVQGFAPFRAGVTAARIGAALSGMSAIVRMHGP